MAKSRPTSLRHLQVFCVAARLSSFKQAAEHLHLTPSAVSHRMRELEGSLDMRLFERRTRAVELTDAGRALYEELAPLLEAVEHTVSRMARRTRRRRLRVTVPQFFASELFVPKLAGFGARWPDIDVQLDSMHPSPSTHPVDADASILLSDTRPDGVIATPLFEMRLAALCSPARLASLGPLHDELPADVALLVHRSRPDGWHHWSGASGIALPRDPELAQFDTMFALVRAAERGMGLALVPAQLGGAWLNNGALVRIVPDDVVTGETYWFATRAEDQSRAEVRALRDWVLVEFGSG